MDGGSDLESSPEPTLTEMAKAEAVISLRDRVGRHL
jgi:hypothetical protein